MGKTLGMAQQRSTAETKTVAMVTAERRSKVELMSSRAIATMERAEHQHQSSLAHLRDEQQMRERERIVSEQAAARRKDAEDAAQETRQASLDFLVEIAKGPVS